MSAAQPEPQPELDRRHYLPQAWHAEAGALAQLLLTPQDFGRDSWDGWRLRFQACMTAELTWSCGADGGSLETTLPGLGVGVCLPQEQAPVLMRTPGPLPRVLWVDLLPATGRSVTARVLPACAPQSPRREPAPAAVPSLERWQELVDAPQEGDLIEFAARNLLASDDHDMAVAVFGVLAETARHRTPNGLVDLMIHLSASPVGQTP